MTANTFTQLHRPQPVTSDKMSLFTLLVRIEIGKDSIDKFMPLALEYAGI